MSHPDDEDLAAMRVLQRLVDDGGVEFVTSRGVSALAPGVSRLLLRSSDKSERASALADWLLDSVEVRELYVEDDALEAILRELWDPALVRQKPGVEVRREDLEAMLLREPDELAHRLVYGDWLQAHRDPLGELITRQVAAAEAGPGTKLEREAAMYLHEHRRALFGPLADYLDTVVRIDWRAGFIERACLGRPDDDPDTYQAAILLRWLLEHRTAMLLRELELRPFDRYRDRAQFGVMLEVVLEQPRPLLRRLAVGERVDWNEQGWYDVGSLVPLGERLPALEVLELFVRSASFEHLRHPTLRELVCTTVVPGGFAGVELPRLESMTFAAPVMHGKSGRELAELELPALRALSTPGNSGELELIVYAHWRDQLESLDLSGGNLQDHDASTLARVSWPRLRRLDLSNNLLGPEGIAALARLCPEVVTANQRPLEPDPDDYYEDAME